MMIQSLDRRILRREERAIRLTYTNRFSGSRKRQVKLKNCRTFLLPRRDNIPWTLRR